MATETTATVPTYSTEGESGGWTIREATTGWIIEGWSIWQGSTTNYKWLYRYSRAFARGADLYAARNEAGTTNGDALRHEAEGLLNDDEKARRYGWKPSGMVRVLRRGHIVQ